MLQTTVIALFMGGWASIYLIDAYLKVGTGTPQTQVYVTLIA